MSSEPRPKPAPPESEPTATATTVPMWLVCALLVLLFLGMWYFDARGGWFDARVFPPYRTVAHLQMFQPPPADEPEGFSRGRVVFKMSCAPCHQDSGLGSAPQGFPPLVESEWVLAEGPNRLIRIVLNGVAGPITVKGQAYGSAVMTPFKDALSDEDIAAVLTFIRTNPLWKHKAAAVTPAQVKAVRDATKDKSGNWSAPELLNLPEK